jgi:hypothetical protein
MNAAPEEQPQGDDFSLLERAWADPAFMAQLMAQRHEEQRQAHALLTESFNRGHAKWLASRGMTA